MKCPYENCTFETDKQEDVDEHVTYMIGVVNDTEHERIAIDEVTGERVAWDRAESDACERGTPGCSIHHTGDTSCQTW